MRLGRSYSESHLRRPVVVFAPAAPTQQQQTITTHSVAVVRTKYPPFRNPRSVLRAPIVVNPAAVFIAQPISITYWTAVKSKQNTSLQRRTSWYRLNPPIIPPLASPIKVRLARIKPPRTNPDLRPPAVIGAGIVFNPVQVNLAVTNLRRDLRVVARQPHSHLFPPIIPPLAPAAVVRLARIRPPRTNPELRPPAVVGDGIVFRSIKVTLADVQDRSAHNQRQRQAHSRLFPPAVIGAGIVFAPLDVTRTYSLRGKPKSILRPPIIPLLAPPVVEKLVTELVRVELADRRPFSRLSPPAIVGAGIVFAPVRVELAPSRRGKPESELFPPTVVASASTFVAAPIQIHLASSRRGQPKSHLSPAAVVGSGVVFRPVAEHLAYSRRGAPKSRLFPAVIPPLAPPVTERLVTELVRVELADRTPHSHLFPPAVIGAGVVFRPLAEHLAYSRRGQPKSTLFEPAVIGAGVVFRPVAEHLTYSRRGQPKSTLRPPVIPLLAPPVETRLAVQFIKVELADRQPHSHLSPPAVVGAGIVFRPVKVILALRVQIEAVRRAPHSELHPPTVVQPQTLLFFGPQEHLAYSVRGKPKSTLRAPAVVGAGIYFRAIDVELSYSRRGKPKSFFTKAIIPPLAAPTRIKLARIKPVRTYSVLRKPAVVGAGIVFRPILEHLAYSRRGKPKSILFEPAVIGDGIVFAPVETHLAYSKRGVAKSVLRKPAVVGAGVVFRPVDVELTYSRFGKPKSHLSPPAVVGIAVLYPLSVNLAYSVRGKVHSKLSAAISLAVFARPIKVKLVRGRAGQPKSFLFVPEHVGVEEPHAPIKTSLAPSRRGRPTSFLRPAAVVLHEPQRGLLVHLALSSRGRPTSFLKSPTVVLYPPHRGLLVHLAPSSRGEPFSKLLPPAVTGDGIYFRSILVHLAPSTRGKPASFLMLPSGVVSRRGCVCGYDISLFAVSSSDSGHDVVSGSDTSQMKVSGEDRRNC